MNNNFYGITDVEVQYLRIVAYDLGYDNPGERSDLNFEHVIGTDEKIRHMYHADDPDSQEFTADLFDTEFRSGQKDRFEDDREKHSQKS